MSKYLTMRCLKCGNIQNSLRPNTNQPIKCTKCKSINLWCTQIKITGKHPKIVQTDEI